MLYSVVIPVYESAIRSVPSVALFGGRHDVEFVICDNSVSAEVLEENRREARELRNCRYLPMGGNRGLPRAYARGIEVAGGDAICIFDDDSTPSSSYFEVLGRHIAQNGSGIYLPIVVSGRGVLSPLNVYGPVIARVRDVGQVRLGSCSAFNTGMAITRDVFGKVSYDDRLFLEFVDHAFCRDAHGAGVRFFLMRELLVEQDYSVEANSLGAALHRDRIGRKDVAQFYSESLPYRLYGRAYLIYRLLRNTLRYRTCAFLFLM